MATEPAPQARAAALIREALRILDKSGENTAAAYLQQALDRLPAETVQDPRQQALQPHIPVIRAMGGALALVASLMGRGGIVPMDEFSRLLGLFAVATSDAADDEGMVLAYWASMVRDAAEARSDGPSSPA